MAGLRPCGGSSLLVLDQHETFGRRGEKGAELSITPLVSLSVEKGDFSFNKLAYHFLPPIVLRVFADSATFQN